jgi:hypothetical protein
MSIAIESNDELEQVRTRLRKMTDAQLVSFGKAARSLCRDTKCPGVFRRQYMQPARNRFGFVHWFTVSEDVLITA